LLPNLDPSTMAKFVDPLPMPQIAQPVGHRLVPGNSGEHAAFYRVAMRAIRSKLHRDLPPATLWSYGGSVPGLMFETRSGQGVIVQWDNELPARHFLPIDHSLHGAEKDKPEVRGVVHLHGGKTPPEGDGYPEDWYPPGHSRTYYYPNRQDPALLWYHDHAMGINRLNIYAGLLGLWVIRDSVEDALNLPQGKFEIPLVLMDRDFRLDGQLSYPVSAEPERPWVPEVFGEAHLVNGKLFPYLDVEPRKYRFRILNGANGRFYWLSMSQGAEIVQIGSDQGLLAAPVAVEHVHLAPGERADVVIDFSKLVGAHVELNSGAQGVLQFRVSDRQVTDPSSVPPNLRTIQRLAPVSATKTRSLTLTEHDNRAGDPVAMTLNEAHWYEPVTEKPILNSTEVWEFLNLTDDVHPIHLHLVRFQLLNRQNFHAAEYLRSRKTELTAPPVPPDPAEAGWKDTIQVYPGTVTRIIVRFEGYTGRYLWHCHILEHEANEMMRPFEVLPVSTAI